MRSPRSFALVLLALPALAACGPSEPGAPETAVLDPAKAADGVFPGDRIVQFTVSGKEGGKPVQLDSRNTGAPTVYCVTSVTCPTTKAYAAKLQTLEQTYTKKGVRFVWLYPNRGETDADKERCQTERGLAGVFSTDAGAAVAKVLEADHTPEMVFVRKDGLVAYRGAIDDGGGNPAGAKNDTLQDAIDAVLAGTPVRRNFVEPAG